jgi:peptide/nickel transport system substrate-binding protein
VVGRDRLRGRARNIDASVFFGGDPGSPDTFQKFYADVQMYANTFNGTDPQTYLGDELCSKIPSPANGGRAPTSAAAATEAYDALHAELTRTAAIEERGRDRPRLNDKVIEETRMIPLVHRGRSRRIPTRWAA